TQILEMDVPVVIALNMMDALKENGQTIDAKGLSKKLGVPVVEISALRNNGLSELMKEAAKAAKEKRKGVSLWAGKEDLAAIKKSSEIYLEDGVENALFHAIKALEGDELEGEKNKPSYEKVIAAYPNVEEYEADSADKRYRYITSELAIFRQGAPKQEKKKLSKSDKIDKVLTNKWAAIPIMLLILFCIFHLVFGGDFLFLNAMGLDLGTYP
ncbi:MAG: ferrous iron transporter B, partial [Bacilli bacterium]|nr:ferrous iron transporter B [Bacilli bacterium]